ncbi:hypothetical protein, partial [Brevundimonas sp.]|uniref:hypothetical protein n=1 Tax=Brevundimonas sp. TaxID=1871086 RepID=UPI0028ABDCA4
EQEDDRKDCEHHKENQRKTHKALQFDRQLNRRTSLTPPNPVLSWAKSPRRDDAASRLNRHDDRRTN